MERLADRSKLMAMRQHKNRPQDKLHHNQESVNNIVDQVCSSKKNTISYHASSELEINIWKKKQNRSNVW